MKNELQALTFSNIDDRMYYKFKETNRNLSVLQVQ